MSQVCVRDWHGGVSVRVNPPPNLSMGIARVPHFKANSSLAGSS